MQAMALAMVIEGIGPFLVPARWRQFMLQLAVLPESRLRLIGGITMGLGVLLLQWARSA